MADYQPNRRSRLSALTARANPFISSRQNRTSGLDAGPGPRPGHDGSSSHHSSNGMTPPRRGMSHSLSQEDNSSQGTHGQPEYVTYGDDFLVPPTMPYVGGESRNGTSGAATGSGSGSGTGSAHGHSSSLSSRRSSFTSLKDAKVGSANARPNSLSVNYVPAKFTKLHSPGNYAHRKEGGGRDAFAKNASRMGMVGTVDDDEGVVFELGKGGLKRKDKAPKLRWNRFKWVLFCANTLLIGYGMATLVSAILVWLNVFFQSDVIRVGNRVELIISTVAAAMIVLTSLIGFSGIMLNNRPFLAVYTFLLWICLGLMVAPGYMTYKQRTFNLEGKINLQWSRNLGTTGRLRIQDALRCCGYFSPYVEATISPLCYARSNLPGCKGHYLRLERRVLETWYTISFALVPAQIGIIIAALLCSNHITYRFGKGLTPKRYRLDMGAMAVIMDEYASQIAAQYGSGVAAEAMNRSSSYLEPGRTPSYLEPSPFHDSHAMSTGATHSLTAVQSRTPSTNTTGFNSQAGSLRPGGTSGAALYDPRRDTWHEGIQGGYDGDDTRSFDSRSVNPPTEGAGYAR